MTGTSHRSWTPLPLLLMLTLATAVAVAPPAARAQTAVVKLATLVPEGSVWDKALRDRKSVV